MPFTTGIQMGTLPVYHLQPTSTRTMNFPLFNTKPKSQSFQFKAQPDDKEAYVSYEGEKSVFPAEANEEVGTPKEGFGEEVKPKPAPEKPPTAAKQQQDRDYVDYKEQKTVFPGEACDELGGEFCEPEYQKGVFPDKVSSK